MMRESQPFFSIIVPTFSRVERLRVCLEALVQLDYPRDRFEVIVVNDGGKMPADAVTPFCEWINVKYIAQPHAGPATARNSGAGHAKGEFLAFTDDDCTPAPDWLQALAARFRIKPGHAIGGRTLNALPQNLCATASQLLIDYLYIYYNGAHTEAVFLTSNNLALPADRFRSLGGFDTSFPLAAGEDREFCDRWVACGHTMIYAPEVLVSHAHALTLRSFFRQHFNYGCGAVQFHRLRARRVHRGIRVEPFSFYLDMLGHPFRQGWNWRAPMLSALLVVSQLANALGFFVEKVTNKRATDECRTSKVG